MANPTGPSPSDAAMTVLIYVDTNKQVGDPNLKVFANARTPRKSGSRKTIPLSKIPSSDEHGLELIPPKGVACGLPVFSPQAPTGRGRPQLPPRRVLGPFLIQMPASLLRAQRNGPSGEGWGRKGYASVHLGRVRCFTDRFRVACYARCQPGS
jgi:hypothetical protein